MLSTAEELKQRLADKDAMIAAEELIYSERARRLGEYRAYIDQLHTQRTTLAGAVDREEAVVRKPTGPCVTEIAPDGVHWNL